MLMSVHTNHEKAASGKWNSIDDNRTEDPVSTKTARHEHQESNIQGSTATAKPLITKSSAQMHVARMGEKRNAYRLLVGKPEGKRPLGRPRCRWVDNIRMDLREVGWSDVDRIGLAQDRNRWRALVNSVLNLWVP
jgi:hypothetical protein